MGNHPFSAYVGGEGRHTANLKRSPCGLLEAVDPTSRGRAQRKTSFPPPDDLDATLQSLLAAGEPATLPHDVLATLAERRRQMNRGARRVEGHYRPGRRLDDPDPRP